MLLSEGCLALLGALQVPTTHVHENRVPVRQGDLRLGRTGHSSEQTGQTGLLALLTWEDKSSPAWVLLSPGSGKKGSLKVLA